MDTTQISHISLCNGYGGIDLGLKRVLPNVRTICYVEIEAICIANLVAKMEEGGLDAAPVWTNLKTFDARPFRGKVDVLSGGFPCQPFSHAGRREGTEDPRHLFPSIERVVSECRPRIIFLENVEGIISAKYGGEPETSVLKYVLERLEALDYTAEAGIFSAEEVGAPHRRKRVFILCVSNNDRERLVRIKEKDGKESTLEEPRREDTDRCCEPSQLGDTQHDGLPATEERRGSQESGKGREEGEETSMQPSRTGGREGSGDIQGGELGDTTGERLEGHARNISTETEGEWGTEGNEWAVTTRGTFPTGPSEEQHDWEAPRIAQPGLGGKSNGSTPRVDRLRMLGNGVVPHTCSKAFLSLMARIIGD